MSTTIEKEVRYCHFIVSTSDILEAPVKEDLEKVFLKGTIEEKKENLKLLVKMITSDDNYPRLIMPVLTNLMQL